MFIILLLISTQTSAASFRCGRSLVKEADSTNVLIRKCGKPVRKFSSKEVAKVRGSQKLVSVSNWVYERRGKKDMIVSGGENVFPREVEEILYMHPAIEEAAVIGLPDPYWVERVHAVIVLKKGAFLEKKEIIDFCKKNLARYKAPKSVEFVEFLPKNPQGKILKRVLRDERKPGTM